MDNLKRCTIHGGSELPGLDAWFRDLPELQEQVVSASDAASVLEYATDGWQLALGCHLQRHFGCVASNLTYFRPTEKKDQLITPTWFSAPQRGGAQVIVPESFDALRSIFNASPEEEIASLSANAVTVGHERSSAFEIRLGCSVIPDGEMSALCLSYLGSRAWAKRGFSDATLQAWMTWLGLIEMSGAPTLRLLRLLEWLCNREEARRNVLPIDSSWDHLAQEVRRWVVEAGVHAETEPPVTEGVVTSIASSLRKPRARPLQFSFNILGHMALRLATVPLPDDYTELPPAFFRYFENGSRPGSLDCTCTDRSTIVIRLLRGEESSRLNGFFLGSHVGMADEIDRLADGRRRIPDWPRFGCLLASLQTVGAPLLLRAVLSEEVSRRRYDFGLQVLGHHSGKLFQESGLVGMANIKPTESVSGADVRAMVRRLWPAWGIAEATRIMKTQGQGMPIEWITRDDGHSVEPAADEVLGQLERLCLFYLSGFLDVLPQDWLINIGTHTVSIRSISESDVDLCALSPFRNDRTKAGTTAVTIGLAERDITECCGSRE